MQVNVESNNEHSKSIVQPGALWLGCLASEAIELENNVPSTFELPEAFENSVNKHWDEYLVRAQAAGKRIWNSTLYRCEEFWGNEERLSLRLSAIEAREVFLTIDYFAAAGVPKCHETRNLFAVCFLKSSDNQYIFGVPSGVTFAAAGPGLIGGALSKDEQLISSGMDIESCLARELEEEINLDHSTIQSAHVLALVQTDLSNIGLIYYVTTSATAKEVAARHRIQNDGELKGVLEVPEREVASFLANGDRYLPLLSQLYGHAMVNYSAILAPK